MDDTPEVRGCVLPLHLHYSVADHTWLLIQEDGIATIGMTDVAQNLAGPLLHAKPKKVGAKRSKGKPVATVESSKWVGPVKSPISGEVVEVNAELAKDATIINKSPYKAGWIVRMKPSNLDAEMDGLLTGQAAVDAYKERIEREDLKPCTHVEGFEI
ncbi:MAG: glycine cleavage system protein GcvH [Planctomycetota bacterium]|jgi:glycine cleavage system H protein|nr:glycine cleavage system protein GcvH [Planctomycetota bacterium]